MADSPALSDQQKVAVVNPFDEPVKRRGCRPPAAGVTVAGAANGAIRPPPPPMAAGHPVMMQPQQFAPGGHHPGAQMFHPVPNQQQQQQQFPPYFPNSPNAQQINAMMMMQHVPVSNNAPPIHYCDACTSEIKDDEKGIQCTADGQGCNKWYHQRCSGLTLPAWELILAEPHADWVCGRCETSKHIEFVRGS